MNEVEAAKAYWFANHSQTARLVEGQPHRLRVAQQVLSHHPRHVVEFGCSSGRNLATIRQIDAEVELTGIDGNVAALTAGRNTHPTVAYVLGDEGMLRTYGDNSVDVVFTLSVLDHVPSPEWKAIYDELVRIARVAVILHEPLYLAREGSRWGYGEVDFKDVGVAAAPHSYAHAYFAHDPEMEIVERLPVVATGDYEAFGQLYHLCQRLK